MGYAPTIHGFGMNWWRVSGPAALAQIDQRVGQHLHGPAGAFKQKDTVSLWKNAFAAPSINF
jgi:hypothetical protein